MIGRVLTKAKAGFVYVFCLFIQQEELGKFMARRKIKHQRG